MAGPPRIGGILETAVYVDDMAAANAFYGEILGLERMLSTDRLVAYNVAPAEVLLVFQRGQTHDDTRTQGGVIPGHHGEGPAHFAFRIAREDVDAWRRHLGENAVVITSEVSWPAGGTSLYFNDPDGNVLELGAPANWPNFTE